LSDGTRFFFFLAPGSTDFAFFRSIAVRSDSKVKVSDDLCTSEKPEISGDNSHQLPDLAGREGKMME
jgi:hypothetical protein